MPIIFSPFAYIFWLAIFFWLPSLLMWGFNWGGVRGFAKSVAASALLLTAMCAPVEYWIMREILVLRPDRFLGISCFGIPLEDYLFFLSFPFLLAPVALKVRSTIEEASNC